MNRIARVVRFRAARTFEDDLVGSMIESKALIVDLCEHNVLFITDTLWGMLASVMDREVTNQLEVVSEGVEIPEKLFQAAATMAVARESLIKFREYYQTLVEP